MAWLSGFKNRIKLTVDHTKIDSDLSHFPLTIFLKSGNGDTIKVFDEVGSNKYKIAVTKADGVTQLYVEIEEWDEVNKFGVLHAGLSGDLISSASDTDYYLYFDNSALDNVNYVGDIGSSPAQQVWDEHYLVVWHLNNWLDSTANGKDLSSYGMTVGNEGKKVNGGGSVNQNYAAQLNFYITSQVMTVEMWVYVTSWSTAAWSDSENIICLAYDNGDVVKTPIYIRVKNSGSAQWTGDPYYSVKGFEATTGNYDYIFNTWYHLVAVRDSNTVDYLYRNGVLEASTSGSSFTPSSVAKLFINHHCWNGGGACSSRMVGDIDEIRISSINRTPAYIKASYHSTNDTLLTYGTKEVFTGKKHILTTHPKYW